MSCSSMHARAKKSHTYIRFGFFFFYNSFSNYKLCCFFEGNISFLISNPEMSEHTHVPITEGVERPDGIKIHPSKKDEPPHDGKPITKLEISPNSKYVVTYSKDDKTIIVWNVEDNEGKLEPDHTVVINHQEIRQI